MPIYDYDGTALHQIGKVYDWDGTTSHQIGKVYDWDGTASSLIYSSEDVILDNSNYATDITGGYVGGEKPNGAYGDGSLVASGVQLPATPYMQYALWTNDTIDFSSYSIMTITYTVTDAYVAPGYNTARGYGIVANTAKSATWSAPDGDSNVNWGTTYQWVRFMSHINYDGVNAGTEKADVNNGTFTKVIDISDWTGNLHLGLIASCGAQNIITVTFNKIVLE